jgi:protein involved in polysaccharide export with SLBB domain
MMKKGFFTIALFLMFLLIISCASTKRYHVEKRINLWSLETGPISGGHFYSADIGDFNGDTLPDIAAGSFEPGGIMVWVGKGDGSWVQISSPSEDGEIQSIAVGDVNNDKLCDIVASSKGSLQGIHLWISKGDGSWDSPIIIDSDSGYQGIKLSDVNNDKLMDIIAANESIGLNGGVRVWINQKHSTWRPILGPERAGRFKNIETADINNDGNTDLIASSIGTKGGIKIWYGDGKGNWSPSVDLDITGYIIGLGVGDVNQDGWIDILTSIYYQGIVVLYNKKDGSFSKAKSIIKHDSFWDILLLDWDNDGKKDIFASSMESNGILSWRNQGNTNWGAINLGLPRNQTYYGLKKGDFNLDNLDDLLAASFSEGIHVWLQTKNGKVATIDTAQLKFKQPAEQLRKKEEFHLIQKNKAFTSIMGFPEYCIAPKDTLTINIWVGKEKKEFNVLVKANGEIFLPYMRLGNIKAAGFSPLQLKGEIENKLANFLKHPVVEVEVKEYIGRKVTLTGEIRSLTRGDTGPGIYPLKGKTTAMEFIAAHGGATDRGNLSQARLIRNGKVYVFNLFKAITQAEVKENPILDEGDLLYIPSLVDADKRLLILGEVRTPGVVSYTGDITLLDAISKAGSFTNDAVLDKIFIVRGNINKPEVVEANLKALVKKGDLTQNITLESGDIIYIPRRFIAKMGDFLKVFHPALLSVQSLYILHRFATEK